METLARMRQLIGATTDWAGNDLVLGNGEIGVEVLSTADKRMKVGDGTRSWSQLPYLPITQAQLDALISALSTETAARTAGDNALDQRVDVLEAGETGVEVLQDDIDLARDELLTEPAV